MFNWLPKVIATVFGVGFAPFAPGTFGSMIGILPFLFIRANGFVVSFVASLLFGIGVWASSIYSNQVKLGDPGQIIIDEVVGIMLAILACGKNPSSTLFSIVIGLFSEESQLVKWLNLHMWAYQIIICTLVFVSFRMFDILKPFPVSYFDKKMHGGLGIMLDDVVAGIMAGLLVRILLFCINSALVYKFL